MRIHPTSTMRNAATLLSLIVLSVFLWRPAAAEELVTGVSHETISITSDFTGFELVVFGTINNIQKATAPDDQATMGRYNIMVLIEGPKVAKVIRRKERIAGIWVNRHSAEFNRVPGSYLLMTSTHPDDPVFDEVKKLLKIGLKDAPFGRADEARQEESVDEFRDAVLRIKMKEGLYRESAGVQFLGDNLFLAKFDIPALVPIGAHAVRSVLLLDGKLISEASHTVIIRKRGFEQLIFDLSRNRSYLYGVFSVLIAILTGWLSVLILRND